MDEVWLMETIEVRWWEDCPVCPILSEVSQDVPWDRSDKWWGDQQVEMLPVWLMRPAAWEVSLERVQAWTNEQNVQICLSVEEAAIFLQMTTNVRVIWNNAN